MSDLWLGIIIGGATAVGCWAVARLIFVSIWRRRARREGREGREIAAAVLRHIAKRWPKLIAQNLKSVKPMIPPTCKAHYLDGLFDPESSRAYRDSDDFLDSSEPKGRG